MHKAVVIILLIKSLIADLGVVYRNSNTGVEEEILLYNKIYALIIGIDNYPNLRFNEQLQYAVSDARAVANSMRDNFQFNEIMTLYNEQATKNNVQQALSNYRKTGKEDGIFIFFGGVYYYWAG